MKIIKPITIVPSMVTTTATEVHPSWSSGTSYVTNDIVVYQYNLYKAINNNSNKIPTAHPDNWLFIGAGNKTAAFDKSYTSQSTGGTSLVFEITPNKMFDSLSILNMSADNILVELIQDSTTVYTRNVALDGTPIVDWYIYFFSEFSQLGDLVFTDIPPYVDSTIRITLTDSSSTAVGLIVLGTITEIGGTQYGIGYGIKDYSVKAEDDFGNIIFTERNYAKKLEPTVMVENTRLRLVTKLLTEIRATPTVFIPSEDTKYDTLITYGFLSDWNVEIPYQNHSLLKLEVKGLT